MDLDADVYGGDPFLKGRAQKLIDEPPKHLSWRKKAVRRRVEENETKHCHMQRIGRGEREGEGGMPRQGSRE